MTEGLPEGLGVMGVRCWEWEERNRSPLPWKARSYAPQAPGPSRGDGPYSHLRSPAAHGVNRDRQVETVKVNLVGSGPRSCRSSLGKGGSNKKGFPFEAIGASIQRGQQR